jgi:hypothetical protein
VDHACELIDEKTTDSEKYRPYKIVDLLLEFGENRDAFCDRRPTRMARSARMIGMAAAMMTMSLYIGWLQSPPIFRLIESLRKACMLEE